MKKIKNKISRFLIIVSLLQFSSRGALAYDGDFSAAFAEFIKVLYLNTQTQNRGTAICVYGSDGISSFIVKDKNTIVLEENMNQKATLRECRVIYVAKNKEKLLKSFIGYLNQSGAATIATFESFTENGGMIFVDIGRRDFELTVNAQVLKASGAKLDSSIATLIVNGNKNH